MVILLVENNRAKQHRILYPEQHDHNSEIKQITRNTRWKDPENPTLFFLFCTSIHCKSPLRDKKNRYHQPNLPLSRIPKISLYDHKRDTCKQITMHKEDR